MMTTGNRRLQEAGKCFEMLVPGRFLRPGGLCSEGRNRPDATSSVTRSAGPQARTRRCSGTVADNSIVVVGGKPPQAGSAETAIVQTAVYDAVNAICGFHLPRMP